MLSGILPSCPPTVFNPLEASVLYRSHLFCTDLQMTWGRNPTHFFAALWHAAKAPTSSHLLSCMNSYLPWLLPAGSANQGQIRKINSLETSEFWFFNDPKHQPEGSKCSNFNNLQSFCVKVERYIFPISNIFGRWNDGTSLQMTTGVWRIIQRTWLQFSVRLGFQQNRNGRWILWNYMKQILEAEWDRI